MLVVDALVEKRLGNSPYPVTETFVPEAFVKRRVAKVELGLRSSVEETTPPPPTWNTVDEFTCKLMKSPLKPEAMLAPMNVPVVAESRIGFGPIWKSWELVETGGVPVRRKARPESED